MRDGRVLVLTFFDVRVTSCKAPFAVTVKCRGGQGLHRGTLSQPVGTGFILWQITHISFTISTAIYFMAKDCPLRPPRVLTGGAPHIHTTHTQEKEQWFGCRPFKSAPTSTWFYNIYICCFCISCYTVIIRLLSIVSSFFVFILAIIVIMSFVKSCMLMDFSLFSGGGMETFGGVSLVFKKNDIKYCLFQRDHLITSSRFECCFFPWSWNMHICNLSRNVLQQEIPSPITQWRSVGSVARPWFSLVLCRTTVDELFEIYVCSIRVHNRMWVVWDWNCLHDLNNSSQL